MSEFTLKLFGPPGSGKTEANLRLLEEEVRTGVPAELIAYTTFGREAIREARRRALGALNRLGPGAEDLPLFRTLHSLAYRLAVRRPAEDWRIRPIDIQRFCTHYQLDHKQGYTPGENPDEPAPLGNIVLYADEWLTNTRRRVGDVRDLQPAFPDRDLSDLAALVERWRAYKQKMGRGTYADTLQLCLDLNPPFPGTVLFVDECQDLNPLQHELVLRWAEQAERVYFAGDDDQTIYTFLGASHRRFLNLRADEVRILDKTHRLSSEVWHYSQEIIGRVADRQAKDAQSCACVDCRARRGSTPEAGRVVIMERPTIETVLRVIDPASTFILARTQRFVRRIQTDLERLGMPYVPLRGNEDAGTWGRALLLARRAHIMQHHTGVTVSYGEVIELARALLEAGHAEKSRVAELERLPRLVGPTWPRTGLGEDMSRWTWSMLRPYLSRVPSVHEIARALGATSGQIEALDAHLRQRPDIEPGGVAVGTIHASKGLQARCVVLASDVSAALLNRSVRHRDEHDTEHRLFYVGATRAVRQLIIAHPFATRGRFPLPGVA